MTHFLTRQVATAIATAVLLGAMPNAHALGITDGTVEWRPIGNPKQYSSTFIRDIPLSTIYDSGRLKCPNNMNSCIIRHQVASNTCKTRDHAIWDAKGWTSSLQFGVNVGIEAQVTLGFNGSITVVDGNSVSWCTSQMVQYDCEPKAGYDVRVVGQMTQQSRQYHDGQALGKYVYSRGAWVRDRSAPITEAGLDFKMTLPTRVTFGCVSKKLGT